MAGPDGHALEDGHQPAVSSGNGSERGAETYGIEACRNIVAGRDADEVRRG